MKQKIIAATIAATSLATLASCTSQRSQDEITAMQIRAATAAGSQQEAINDLRTINGFTCDEIKESVAYAEMRRGTVEVTEGWLILTMAAIACPGGIDAVLDEVESR